MTSATLLNAFFNSFGCRLTTSPYYSASITTLISFTEPVYRYTNKENQLAVLLLRGASLYTEADASQQFFRCVTGSTVGSWLGSSQAGGSTYSATASSGITRCECESPHHEDEHHSCTAQSFRLVPRCQ